METIIVYINNFNDNNYKDIILKYDSKYFNKKSLETLKVNIENIISKDNSLKIIIEQLRILGVIKTAKIEKVIKTYKNRGKSDFNNQIYSRTMLETLHGVKGDEFDKVIVNIRENQGWTNYNFDKFFLNGLEKQKSSINTHKLLYVACTRAKTSLIINYIATNKNKDHISQICTNLADIFGEYIEFRKY